MKRYCSIISILFAVLCLAACNKENAEDSNVPKGAVDLGLSVYWGECNLGATTPEGYGDRYAWGERTAKTDFTLYNYSYYTSGDIETHNTGQSNIHFSKYTPWFKNADTKTRLDLDDDAAHVKIGGKWRIPTMSECEELIEKCTWTRTTRNGVNVFEVKSNINGAIIYFPLPGVIDETGWVAEKYGVYWTADMSTGSDSWGHIFFMVKNEVGSKENIIDVRSRSYERWYGLPIRPISEK